MNKERRAMLKKAKEHLHKAEIIIENVLEEEEESYDNLPEGIQMSDRGEKMENAIEKLNEAIDLFEEIFECISEASD